MQGGANPSPFDGRDIQYWFPGGVALPSTARLNHEVPARNQQDVPCCVSIALVVCMEILDARHGDFVELSPLFHYWKARPDPSEITPLAPRTAFQIASDIGISRRALHDPPFTPEGCRAEPTEDANADAREHRLQGFDPVTRTVRYEMISASRPAGCRSAIARGFPVLAAFWLTSAYWSITREKPVHPEVPPEASADGHAVALVGYDDVRAAFLAKDSRGQAFGRDGEWWLPYDLLDSNLVYEAWALTGIDYDT